MIAFFAERLIHSEGIFEEFFKKQQTYGSNNKLEEFQVVFNSLMSANFLDAFFGKGWGATWFSPAVGMEVNYAHSLITYGALKLGILGIFLTAGYCLYIIRLYIHAGTLFITKPKQIDFDKVVIMTAAICSMLVGGLLESAYKTLDFGIITLAFLLAYYYVSIKPTKKTITQ